MHDGSELVNDNISPRNQGTVKVKFLVSCETCEQRAKEVECIQRCLTSRVFCPSFKAYPSGLKEIVDMIKVPLILVTGI